MKSALSFLIAAKRCEITGLQQLSLTSELVRDIGALVHALQRERGLSNLYLGSKGANWSNELAEQIEQTDALQARTLAGFDRLDTDTARSGNGARLFSHIAFVMQGLSALPGLRARVQTQKWSTARVSTAYIRLVNGLLTVVFEAADSATDPDISRCLVALFNFMQGKEFSGQERATGSALFAAGRADADGQQRLLHLIDSQDRCLQVFGEFTSDPLRAAWAQAQRPEVLAVVERLRRVLLTTSAGGVLDAAQSQVWFDACTARLDAMKLVEDALASDLQSLCDQRLQAAERELSALASMESRGASAQEADFFEEASPPRPITAPALPGAAQGYGPMVERSILELVQEQAQRLQTMGSELDTVRASLNERKVVERAKGLLMAHRQLSEDEAHKTMRQMAMNQNRRLIDVAEAVLSMADVLPAAHR